MIYKSYISEEVIIIKRPKKFLMIFLIPMLLLMYVILNITFLKGNQYANMAAEQRTGKSDSQRGCITDRNMIPFTGFSNRYSERSLAPHIIGYTDSSGTGISGIEKAMEDALAAPLESDVILKDATGNDISAFKANGVQTKDMNYVKLTLDYHIQKIAENVLDDAGIIGAVVVLDVETFDILAMASRPDFNQNSVEDYISSDGTELLNRATSPYNAGSIFKIVTAAAALEEGISDADTIHLCNGNMIVDTVIFPCHHLQGHGFLNTEEAFALSCNCTFYNLGINLGSDTLCRYADKFGMGKQVIDGYIPESEGNIPDDPVLSASEAANLSIGQGEIMITPLQAARLAAIIASGGMAKDVNLIEGIADISGNMIKHMRRTSSERVISKNTAEKIGDMMLKVTESGTGTNAKSDYISIAGKTGSAETGWQTENDYMVQGWFVGYFPYDNPKYALAVMTENGRQGNASCGPVFKEIAERIVEMRY